MWLRSVSRRRSRGHDRSRLPELHFAGDFAERGDASVDFADFFDVDAPAFALDLAAVGDLAAGLDIEWRFTKDYGDAAVGEVVFGDDFGGDVEGIVAGEDLCSQGRTAHRRRGVSTQAQFSGGLRVCQWKPARQNVLIESHLFGFAFFLRLRPLRLERGLEPGDVHRVSALARHQLGEIDRESERVVELECIFAGNRPVDRSRSLSGFLGRELVEAAHAAFDRRQEALLFRAGGIDDVLRALAQLRIDVAHLVDDDAHDFHQRRLPAAEQPRVAHRAAEDPSQDVAATFVRGENSIREQERDGATVVRDDPERGRLCASGERVALRRALLRAGRASLSACLRGFSRLRRGAIATIAMPDSFLDGLDQVDEDIRVEIVRFALHDRGDALEAGSGIY